MFAPWCPTCQTRRLLGPRRIVRFDGHDAVLRCWCGEEVAWDAEPAAVEPVRVAV